MNSGGLSSAPKQTSSSNTSTKTTQTGNATLKLVGIGNTTQNVNLNNPNVTPVSTLGNSSSSSSSSSSSATLIHYSQGKAGDKASMTITASNGQQVAIAGGSDIGSYITEDGILKTQQYYKAKGEEEKLAAGYEYYRGNLYSPHDMEVIRASGNFDESKYEGAVKKYSMDDVIAKQTEYSGSPAVWKEVKQVYEQSPIIQNAAPGTLLVTTGSDNVYYRSDKNSDVYDYTGTITRDDLKVYIQHADAQDKAQSVLNNAKTTSSTNVLSLQKALADKEKASTTAQNIVNTTQKTDTVDISSLIDNVLNTRDNMYYAGSSAVMTGGDAGTVATGVATYGVAAAADIIAPLDAVNAVNKIATGRIDEMDVDDWVYAGLDVLSVLAGVLIPGAGYVAGKAIKAGVKGVAKAAVNTSKVATKAAAASGVGTVGYGVGTILRDTREE